MFGGAQQALQSQIGSTGEDPALKASLIAAINGILPTVSQSLASAGYPRHAYASFRANEVPYGNPIRQVCAWTREISVEYIDYGFNKVPDGGRGVGILIDESNQIRVIGTPNASKYGYGDYPLESLNLVQLRALQIICSQLCGPPKVPTWKVPPLNGRSD